MGILPFTILVYSSNPIITQIGLPVSVGPVPGFSAVSYALTGTLPLGLSLDSTTGVVSGTPTALTTEPVTVTVTATLANATTTTSNLIVSVMSLPINAIAANTNTNNDKASLRMLLETNFVNNCAYMIANNSSLGLYSLFADVPAGASIKDLRKYFMALNYSFELVYPSQNPNEYYSEFGLFPDYYEYPYPDFTQPYPIVRDCPSSHRKIRLSWGQNYFPYWLYPFYYYGKFPAC